MLRIESVDLMTECVSSTMASEKDKSLDQKGSEEEDIYKALDSLGTGATHRGNTSSNFQMSMGASMEFMDSFACIDDDDDLADLRAEADKFQKEDSEKPKTKQPPRTASRQPNLDFIGEDEEEEEEEEGS